MNSSWPRPLLCTEAETLLRTEFCPPKAHTEALSPGPQMWLDLDLGAFRGEEGKMRPCGRPCSNRAVFLTDEEETEGHAHTGEAMEIQQGGGRLQAQRRGLRRSRPCRAFCPQFQRAWGDVSTPPVILGHQLRVLPFNSTLTRSTQRDGLRLHKRG